MFYLLRFIQATGMFIVLAGIIGGMYLDSLRYELMLAATGLVLFYVAHTLLKKYYTP